MLSSGITRTLALLIMLPLGALMACTVPVFRYALDHWNGDDFVLEVPSERLALIEKEGWLQPFLDSPELNLRIVGIEVARSTARLVSFGGPRVEPKIVWEGELDEPSFMHIVDSPARQAVFKRILEGQSAVWVVVGPEGEERRELNERLERRLSYLEDVSMLPVHDPFDPESKIGPGPEIGIGFSTLLIDPAEASEKAFVRMLKGGSPAEQREDVFAAVMFGRGRVLGVWNASELDDPGIDEVSLYLLGACSCQVKAQNPGWDVVAKMFWQKALVEIEEARLIGELGSSDGEGLSIAESEDQPPAELGKPAVDIVSIRPREATPAQSPELESAGKRPLAFRIFGIIGLVGVGAGFIVARWFR